MPKHIPFEVQGHRGARGLLPENTLAGFEKALDLGVSSIETDVFLTSDEAVVLFHDPALTDRICINPWDSDLPSIATKPLVRSLTLQQVRQYRIAGETNSANTPLSHRFAEMRGLAPLGIPTLADLFDFVETYVGHLGAELGKTSRQQERARRVIFDLELKRIPFFPHTVGDGFNGREAALLERRVVEMIANADVVNRTRVRSFDHRSIAAIKQLEPRLGAGLLTHHTAPMQIGAMLAAAGADIYCPDYHFVDAEIVEQVHAAKKRIIPYTVNEPQEWEQLVAWRVDGVTTDFPDRLMSWLAQRGAEVL